MKNAPWSSRWRGDGCSLAFQSRQSEMAQPPGVCSGALSALREAVSTSTQRPEDRLGRSGATNRHRLQRPGARHLLGAHGAPAQETARLVIEPLADFLANAPPVLGRRLDRLGHDDFLRGRADARAGAARAHAEAIGPSSAVAPAPRRRRGIAGAGRGASRPRARALFLGSSEALPEQQQLRGIEPFALRPEELADERVDLLAE